MRPGWLKRGGDEVPLVSPSSTAKGSPPVQEIADSPSRGPRRIVRITVDDRRQPLASSTIWEDGEAHQTDGFCLSEQLSTQTTLLDYEGDPVPL